MHNDKSPLTCAILDWCSDIIDGDLIRLENGDYRIGGNDFTPTEAELAEIDNILSDLDCGNGGISPIAPDWSLDITP